MPSKPLIDYTDKELIGLLRRLYENGRYSSSPNDVLRELRHRQASHYARSNMIASMVSATVATIAVVLSAMAFIGS